MLKVKEDFQNIKGINFRTLFKKLKPKVIKHFLSTAPLMFIHSVLTSIASNIFETKKLVDNNYSKLLPELLQKFVKKLEKGAFVAFGIVLVFFYAILYYFCYLWEEQLIIHGGHYVKNSLLAKFRKLSFEDKKTKKDELRVLAEVDSGNIGWYWEHIPNHVFHSILTILFSITLNYTKLFNMGIKAILFSLICLIAVNLLNFYLTSLVIKNERRYKEELAKEWEVINKEIGQANLIEGMGLSSQYQNKQLQVTQKNEDLLVSFIRTKALSKTVPVHWLIQIFPFILLLLTKNFVGGSLLIIWIVFDNFASIFECFWDYSDYSSSLSRVNSFLRLPEKNDNLGGVVLNSDIKIEKIRLENVLFKYADGTDTIKANRVFSRGDFNRVTEENGTGKSTILRLILGIITPQQGQIIVETSNNKQYNLNQDLNLKAWRENNVAYAAHDNLIAMGSTGQKQLKNIESTLNKSVAQLLLFDEADNALDKEKKSDFSQKLEKLSKDKLVVYVNH